MGARWIEGRLRISRPRSALRAEPWASATHLIVFGCRTQAPNQIERGVGRPVPGLAPGASIKAPRRGLKTQTSNQQGAGWAIDPGVDGMGLDRAACRRAADGWTQRSTPTVRVRADLESAVSTFPVDGCR